jgi:hypothetical protein
MPRTLGGFEGAGGAGGSSTLSGPRVIEQALAPEQVLPAQFYEVWCCTKPTTPERELAVSVLFQAAMDLVKCRNAAKGRKRRLYREAYQWVLSDDRSWPFSFVNLCDMLNFSPPYLRRQLLRNARSDWRSLQIGAAA